MRHSYKITIILMYLSTILVCISTLSITLVLAYRIIFTNDPWAFIMSIAWAVALWFLFNEIMKK